MEPLAPSPFPADFFTIVLVMSLVLVAMLRQRDTKWVKTMLRSAFNNRLLIQTVREGRQLNLTTTTCLIFVLGVFSAFFQLSYYTFIGWPDLSPPLFFLLLFLGLLCLASIRIAMLSLLVKVYGTDDFVPEYAMNLLVYNFLFALVLVPLLIGAAYGPEEIRNIFLITGWLAFLAMALVRLGKIFYVGIMERGVPLLYNIFYICGLEILPLIVVFTAITR